MPSSTLRPAVPTTSTSAPPAAVAARGAPNSTLTSSFSFRSSLTRNSLLRSSAASAHAPSPLRRAVQRLSGAPAGAAGGEETGRVANAPSMQDASPGRGMQRSTTATLPAQQRIARLPVARSTASLASRKRLDEGGEGVSSGGNSLGKRRQTREGSEGSATTYDESEEGKVDEFGRISPSIEVRHGRRAQQANNVRPKSELGASAAATLPAARPASIVTSTLPRIQSGIPVSPSSGKLSKIPRSGTLADVHAASSTTTTSAIPRSRTNSSFGTLPARTAASVNSPRTAAAAAAKARTLGGVPALGLPAKGRARSSLPGAAATHNRRLSFGLPSNDASAATATQQSSSSALAQEGIAAVPRRPSVRTAEAERERSLRRASTIGLPVLTRPNEEPSGSTAGTARSRRSSFSGLSAGSSAATAPNEGKETFPRRTNEAASEQAKAAAGSSAAVSASAAPRAAPRQSAATMPLRSRRSVLPPPNSFRTGPAMEPPSVQHAADTTSRLQRKDSLVKARVAALETASPEAPVAGMAKEETNDAHAHVGEVDEAADAWEEEDTPSALEAYAQAAAVAVISSGGATHDSKASHLIDSRTSTTAAAAASTTPVRVPAVALLRKARSAIPRSGSASSLATPEARARGMRRLSGLSLNGAFKAGAEGRSGPRSSTGSAASPSAMKAQAGKVVRVGAGSASVVGTPLRSKLPTTSSSSRLALSPAKATSRLAKPVTSASATRSSVAAVEAEADTTRDIDANLQATLQLMANKAGISLDAVRAIVSADAAARQPLAQGTTSPTSTPPRHVAAHAHALQQSSSSQVGLDSLASVGQRPLAESSKGSLGLDLTSDQTWATLMSVNSGASPEVSTMASRSAPFAKAREVAAYDESLDESRIGGGGGGGGGSEDVSLDDSMLGPHITRVVTTSLLTPDVKRTQKQQQQQQRTKRFAPRETIALDVTLAEMELRSPMMPLMSNDLLDEDLNAAVHRMGLGGMSAYGESVGGGGLSTVASPMPVERVLAETEGPTQLPQQQQPATPQKEGVSASSSAASIWASESAKKARAAAASSSSSHKRRISQPILSSSPATLELLALREAHAQLEAQLASLQSSHKAREVEQSVRIESLQAALEEAEQRAEAAEEQRSADEAQAEERQRIDEEARYELGERAEGAALALQAETQRVEKVSERLEKAEKKVEAVLKSKAALEKRCKRAEADARRARIAEAEGRWREVAALSKEESLVSARELAQLALAQCATWERTLTSTKPTISFT